MLLSCHTSSGAKTVTAAFHRSCSSHRSLLKGRGCLFSSPEEISRLYNEVTLISYFVRGEQSSTMSGSSGSSGDLHHHSYPGLGSISHSVLPFPTLPLPSSHSPWPQIAALPTWKEQHFGIFLHSLLGPAQRDFMAHLQRSKTVLAWWGSGSQSSPWLQDR